MFKKMFVPLLREKVRDRPTAPPSPLLSYVLPDLKVFFFYIFPTTDDNVDQTLDERKSYLFK